MSDPLKLISFYLPQYHPIPENDVWWGKGFTEWANVAKALPRYKGHTQPHLPADLGFYDLRVSEVREAQAALAKEYGIFGFCYYYYWFSGRKLLNRPFEEVLQSKSPDFPFCLCWANENWTRRWDGNEEDVLIAQNYTEEDDYNFIREIIPAMKDPRYIRIHNKPILLIWRPQLFPDPRKTAQIWRQEAKKNGLDDIYIVGVESWYANIDPSEFGYDAATQFAPQSCFNYGQDIPTVKVNGAVVASYTQMMQMLVEKKQPDYRFFRSICPNWDNSSRREKGEPFILQGSSPEAYAYFLKKQIEITKRLNAPEEQIIFINAWNEWGEGAHLEPDTKNGYRYLEATRSAKSGKAIKPVEIERFSPQDFEEIPIGHSTSIFELYRDAKTDKDTLTNLLDVISKEKDQLFAIQKNLLVRNENFLEKADEYLKDKAELELLIQQRIQEEENLHDLIRSLDKEKEELKQKIQVDDLERENIVRRISILQQANDELITKAGWLETERAKLLSQITEHETLLEAVNARNNSLNESNAQRQEQISQLTEDLNALEKARSNLEKECNLFQVQNESTLSELNALKIEISIHQKRENKLFLILDEKGKELLQLKTSLSEVQNQLSEKSEEVLRLELDVIEKLNSALDKKGAESQRLEQELAKREKLVRTLEERNVLLQSSEQNKTEEVGFLQNELIVLKERMLGLNKLTEELKKDKQQLFFEINQSKLILEGIIRDNRTLSQEKESLAKDLEEFSAQAQKVENWYKATYVHRSIFGVLKDRIFKRKPFSE